MDRLLHTMNEEESHENKGNAEKEAENGLFLSSKLATSLCFPGGYDPETLRSLIDFLEAR